MRNDPLSDEDRALLERIQKGDRQAMVLLYDRHAGMVYSIAHRVLRDPSLAEQVLQDIFLEIWRNPERLLNLSGGVRFLLLMIARNRSFALRLHQAPSNFDFAPLVSIANYQEREMTLEQARGALEKIPVERRALLEWAFFDRTDTAETADSPASKLAGAGVDMRDLETDAAFAHRRLHVRDAAAHIEGMNRLARVFAEDSTAILQELVTAAVELCGADSAGISVFVEDNTEGDYFQWVATAGQYSRFVGGRLPRFPSPCGLTLERGRPQVYSVSQRFFDLMGVQAPIVTDGMLFPWQTGETRGTIWVLAHGRKEAFDREDCRMMQTLASFAATGVRFQQHQQILMKQTTASAEAAMATRLAHEINNPLQSLMQVVFLFSRGGAESGAFAQQAMDGITGLSDLVNRILANPQ